MSSQRQGWAEGQESRSFRSAVQRSLRPNKTRACKAARGPTASHTPFNRRTQDGEPYTPDHKAQKTPGTTWMLKEEDMNMSETELKTNLQNLCDLYGWNFVDTTTSEPGPSLARRRCRRFRSYSCLNRRDNDAYPL